MKKVLIMLGVIGTIVLCSKPVEANSDYKSFQEICFEEEGFKFMHEYTDEELVSLHESVDCRKMFGWNTEDVVEDEKVIFIDKTVFDCSNEDASPITYKIQLKEEIIEKRGFSVKGTLGIELDGKIKKFKSGLDAKLNIEYSNSSTFTKRSEWYAKVDIDEGTRFVVDIIGEGYVRNGVASKYVFWVRTQTGEYEIFTISTEYYRMEKKKLC